MQRRMDTPYIAVHCPKCGKKFRIPKYLIGKHTCDECEEVTVITEEVK
jgi:RNase P subunit RPR2